MVDENAFIAASIAAGNQPAIPPGYEPVAIAAWNAAHPGVPYFFEYSGGAAIIQPATPGLGGYDPSLTALALNAGATTLIPGGGGAAVSPVQGAGAGGVGGVLTKIPWWGWVAGAAIGAAVFKQRKGRRRSR